MNILALIVFILDQFEQDRVDSVSHRHFGAILWHHRLFFHLMWHDDIIAHVQRNQAEDESLSFLLQKDWTF